MSKPKIMWLCSPLESRYGVMNIIRGWASRMDFERFDVTLVHHSPNPEELRSRLAQFPRLKVVHMPQLWSFSKLYVPAVRSLIRLLKREHFDIVHTIFVQSDVLGAVAAHFAGVRVVISSVMGYLVNPVGCAKWKRPIYNTAYRLIQKKIDRIIAITRTTGKQLVEDFGVPAEKIDVVYSGVDQKVYSRQPRPEGSFTIGFVGMLIPQKGTATLIEAAPMILKRIPGARFVVVGDGPARTGLEAHARDLKVRHKIEFLGFCEDVPRQMAGFDAFAFTSWPSYDGLPRVILEAMVQRTPVLASRTEPIEEIVSHGHTGWLFEPGDAGGLASLALALHATPESVASVVERAYQRVLRISVEREVEQLQNIYRRLITTREPDSSRCGKTIFEEAE